MNKFVNNVKTVLLLGTLSSIIVFAGAYFGGHQGALIALIMAGVGNFVMWFFSDKLALASMSAQEVGPDHPLYQIVEPLAKRANLPMPRVYVSPEAAPNAFATGRNPRHSAVCATDGLMRMLNRNEIAGVMAHELAHIKYRDVLTATIAATLAGAISYLGYMAMFSGGNHRDDEEGGSSNPLVGLLLMILGPIAAMLLQAMISRSREFNADTAGAEICGDPMHLATALQKVHVGASQIPLNTNPAFNALMIAEPLSLAGGLGKLFASHPPLEDRLHNLIGDREIPDNSRKQTIAW